MILFKKAVVSMLRNKKAYLSCILLIALGVGMYATMNTALLVLEEGKNDYYESYRLGDAFATVAQMPRTGLQELLEIEGVEQVDGRLVENFRIMVEDEPETVYTLHLITTIAGENDRRLNAYHVDGNGLEQPMDILVGEDMHAHFGFEEGDTISLLVNGKVVDFHVKGSIYSPEYVYTVQNASELFSDTTKYNIGYVDEETFMNLTGQNGIYTDLSFRFEEDVDFDDVKDELEAVLKPNDLVALYGKEDLVSYMMFEEEIQGGRSMSTTIPMTFVVMAAIVLYLMLKRIIEQDRTQIGILKALGYSNAAVLGHYIFYGFATGIIGVVAGLAISAAVTSPYIDFYLAFYKMPIGTAITNYRYFLLGGIMAVGSGIFGAYLGASAIIRLKPADAMRPKAPRPIRRDIADYLPFLRRILTARGLMAARNLPRNKVRSLFVILGIMFSFTMMVYSGMMNDMMDAMFFNQFNHVMKYDAEMGLHDSVPYEQGVQAAMALEGAAYAEGVLKVPVLVHKGFKSTGTQLVGIPEGSQLYKVYDDDRRMNLALTQDGMILASNIAKQLDAAPGDRVVLESPYFKEDITITVYDVVQQSVGASGFINLSLLADLMDQEERTNGIIFNYTDIQGVRQEMASSSQVSKIEDKKETLVFYEDFMGSYYFLFYVIEAVAILIGFTIIYNTAVISMSERSREYATLRVIGLRIKEVKEIMSFEYWILCIAGIALGFPFSVLMNWSLSQMIDIEAFSWPSEIPPIAFVYAIVGCVIAVFLSNLASMRTIRHLSLVEVLKERE